jgi:hypothetical protein
MILTLLTVKGRRKIIFIGRKNSLEKFHSTVNFVLCRISVNCPGTEMGCESLGGDND